jgi:hypothetical protein
MMTMTARRLPTMITLLVTVLIMAIAAPAMAATDGGGGVTWSRELAGPSRGDLERALDVPFENAWDTRMPKTDERRRVTSCREALALPRGFAPDDQSDPAWYAFVTMLVRCRVIEQMGKAVPARADHLGKFTLDNARLAELPALLHPLPGPRDAIARLQAASADGVSWKKWDASIRVDKRKHHGEGVSIVGKDVDCFLQMLGRGDLNGDGIEDVVLLRSGGGRRGTWNAVSAFVLTRRAPGQRVEVLREIN